MKDNLIEETLHTEAYYFQDHKKYTPESVYKICKGLVAKAESGGLKNCFLSFNSNYEPYEDYLGLPSVTPCGYREMNNEEKEDRREQEIILKYSKANGITFYEASALYKLKDKLGLEF